ncbi:unnamed protein product [Xylocopa violacea]|uniref:Uncharacterized protein n=1 Tax=Xylocopa violacea TaxID=135666 RepID=A0ABP1P1B4_XYLVO
MRLGFGSNRVLCCYFTNRSYAKFSGCGGTIMVQLVRVYTPVNIVNIYKTVFTPSRTRHFPLSKGHHSAESAYRCTCARPSCAARSTPTIAGALLFRPMKRLITFREAFPGESIRRGNRFSGGHEVARGYSNRNTTRKSFPRLPRKSYRVSRHAGTQITNGGPDGKTMDMREIRCPNVGETIGTNHSTDSSLIFC